MASVVEWVRERWYSQGDGDERGEQGLHCGCSQQGVASIPNRKRP
jgi:hypothetical protein